MLPRGLPPALISSIPHAESGRAHAQVSVCDAGSRERVSRGTPRPGGLLHLNNGPCGRSPSIRMLGKVVVPNIGRRPMESFLYGVLLVDRQYAHVPGTWGGWRPGPMPYRNRHPGSVTATDVSRVHSMFHVERPLASGFAPGLACQLKPSFCPTSLVSRETAPTSWMRRHTGTA
jgi:hypothetical protein